MSTEEFIGGFAGLMKMTRQNVAVSDCTSRIGMGRLASSKSALFSTAMPEPLPALGGHIAIPQRRLSKKLETGGARVCAWVDSMRASSPTRIKSPASLSGNEEQSSWTVSASLCLDYP